MGRNPLWSFLPSSPLPPIPPNGLTQQEAWDMQPQSQTPLVWSRVWVGSGGQQGQDCMQEYWSDAPVQAGRGSWTRSCLGNFPALRWALDRNILSFHNNSRDYGLRNKVSLLSETTEKSLSLGYVMSHQVSIFYNLGEMLCFLTCRFTSFYKTMKII